MVKTEYCYGGEIIMQKCSHFRKCLDFPIKKKKQKGQKCKKTQIKPRKKLMKSKNQEKNEENPIVNF
jgi:hypothetical protein